MSRQERVIIHTTEAITGGQTFAAVYQHVTRPFFTAPTRHKRNISREQQAGLALASLNLARAARALMKAGHDGISPATIANHVTMARSLNRGSRRKA